MVDAGSGSVAGADGGAGGAPEPRNCVAARGLGGTTGTEGGITSGAGAAPGAPAILAVRVGATAGEGGDGA